MNSATITGKTRLRLSEHNSIMVLVLQVQLSTFDYGRQDYTWRDATVEDLSVYGYTPAALNIPTL